MNPEETLTIPTTCSLSLSQVCVWPNAVLLAHIVSARTAWPDDQTARRDAECIVQDVDIHDLVLEVVVVEGFLW